jgi:integral membrane sensor domain MASE1
LLANYSISQHIWSSLGIATGNLLEAVVGAALVTQFANGRRAFDRAGDIFRFVLYAAILGTAISATIGTTVLELAQLATWDRYGPIWLTWWLGDMVSALTVAPLLIIWIARPLPRNLAISEVAAMLSVAVGTALIVFGPISPPRTPIGYFSILPLLWAAFRFHQHGAASTFFVTAAIAVVGTLKGYGPNATKLSRISMFGAEL